MRQVSSVEMKQSTPMALTHAHIQRMKTILDSDIDDLLPQTPYLLPAARPTLAGSIVEDALKQHLQAAELDFVDGLLCELAVFTVERGFDGRRSDLNGVDLEFNTDSVRYLISVRPRPGDDTMSEKLRARALRHAMNGLNHAVQPVLGYCYGKAPTGYVGGCLRVTGPNFWYFISGNRNLYTDIIEVITHKVKTCRDSLSDQETCANNRMLKQFINRYCDERGAYDWNKFVARNNCDLDLPQFQARA